MRIAIIDNDSSIREGLKALLLTTGFKSDSIKEAGSVLHGLQLINAFQPELVFLDVEMDDGTGFDLLQKIGNYNFQLVFITAHNKYAVNAFKFSAIDFLLKPIDPLELAVSVNKASNQIRNKNLEAQINLLKENLQQANNKKTSDRKIALSDNNIIHYIKLGDVIYCKAEGSYTVFYISEGRKIMVSRLLKEYEELFEEFGFLRTHHSYLINTSKIFKFDKNDGGQLILEENHCVPVSSRKREMVLEILGKI